MAKLAYAVGAQVEHQKFGLGSVTACTDEQIAIKFDDHGEKKFMLSIALAHLKKSDRQAPLEKKRASRKKVAKPAAETSA
jgi:hypothetical protein